jgi:uncharacterized protein (TIRG00374 family)
MTHRASLVVGVILGLTLFAAAAALIDWNLLRATLGQAHTPWVIVAVAAVPLYIFVKTWRWRVLITPIAVTSTASLSPAVWAGNAGNYIVPHFGELVRVVLAGHSINANRSALLASIALERFFDFAALGVLCAVVLLPARDHPPVLTAALGIVVALALALLMIATLFLLWPDALFRISGRLLRPLAPRLRSPLERALNQGTTALAMLRTWRLVIPVFLLSLVQWVVIGACTAACMLAMGLAVSCASVAAVVLLNVVGLVLPAAPGHVGTIQVAFIVALQSFGIARESAFAAALVFNAVMVVPVMLVGLPILSRAGVRLGAYLAGGERGEAT